MMSFSVFHYDWTAHDMPGTSGLVAFPSEPDAPVPRCDRSVAVAAAQLSCRAGENGRSILRYVRDPLFLRSNESFLRPVRKRRTIVRQRMTNLAQDRPRQLPDTRPAGGRPAMTTPHEWHDLLFVGTETLDRSSELAQVAIRRKPGEAFLSAV